MNELNFKPEPSEGKHYIDVFYSTAAVACEHHIRVTGDTSLSSDLNLRPVTYQH